MEDEYLTTKELAQRVKMAPGTIRNLVWKQELKENIHYVKPTPRKVLFIWAEIKKWLYREPSSLEASNQARSRINI